MTDEEIKEMEKEAKEYAQGNFYSEQGFLYGYEIGFEKGRKEIEQWKQEWQDAQIKANEEGFARTTLQIKCTNLEKEIEELKDRNVEIEKILEKANSELSKESLNCMELSKDNEELKSQIENYKLSENESKEIIAELKKEISVLLSCSNCPENKGGYICEKEYNNKCLAQKVEYIKELKAQIEKMKCDGNCKHSYSVNTGGCYDTKCELTGLDCINCKDKWELAE